MTDRATVADWIGRYLLAWDSNDPADVRALFTEDAQYRWKPYEDAVTGHRRIVAAWLDGRDEAGDHRFTWRTIAVDGAVAVVQGCTEYLRGTVAGSTFDNLWVIRFAGDGRAAAFTEWWMQRPGEEQH